MIKKKMKYNKYKDLKEIYEKKVNIISSTRLIIFIIMLLSFILKHYYYETLFTIIFIINIMVINKTEDDIVNIPVKFKAFALSFIIKNKRIVIAMIKKYIKYIFMLFLLI